MSKKRHDLSAPFKLETVLDGLAGQRVAFPSPTAWRGEGKKVVSQSRQEGEEKPCDSHQGRP